MGANFLKNDAMKLVQSIKPQLLNADGTTNGTAINRNSYKEQYQDAKVLISIGELTSDGTVSITVTVEDSANNSDFAAVTDLEVIEAASYVATTENHTYDLGLRLQHCRQYVRAKVVIDFTAGTSPTQGIEVAFLLLNPRWNPAETNS
jgi:hypothetical protein